MNQWRNRTIGELVDGLNRYRAAISFVLAFVLCLTLLPARVRTIDTQAGGAAASGPFEPGAAASVEGAVQGPGTAGDGGAAGPGAGTAGDGGSAGTGTGGPARTAAVSVEGVSFPGLGSPQALGAPDCDPRTGNLRMQTLAWSLPCVPLWPQGADNGGATARGVTADSIKVLVYLEAEDPARQASLRALGAYDSPASLRETVTNYVNLFSRHAETYGRKIELVFYTGSGNSPEQARADAIDAVNKHKPFAATMASPSCTAPFLQEIALRQVVALCPGKSPTLQYIKSAEPYFFWVANTSSLPAEQQAIAGAALIADGLVGRPAKWAGDPVLRTQTRKIGWIFVEGVEGASTYNQLFASELKRRGVPIAASAGVTDIEDPNGLQEKVRVAVVKMKEAGVTTVVVDIGSLDGYAGKEATQQRYFPEWFATGVNGGGTNLLTRIVWDPAQSGSYFAFRAVQVKVPNEKTDSWGLYRWEYGANPSALIAFDLGIAPSARALFAGVQLAGPRLTPISFRDGLFKMEPVGGAASRAVTSVQQSWGLHGIWPFEANNQPDYAGTDDLSYGWWSQSDTCDDEVGNRGAGCFMIPDGGRRYVAAKFPREEPKFFVREGAVAEYPDLPPGERPPTYENKKGCATRWQCYGS